MLTLIIINVTAFIAGWMLRGYWRRPSSDNRSEEIVHQLATWAAIMNGRTAQKIADSMLYSAACIHYRSRTDAMDSSAAARWVRAQVNSLVAEAVALTEPEKP